MTDIVDSKTRSRMMAGIKGKDTKPEMLLRQFLHSKVNKLRVKSDTPQGFLSYAKQSLV